MNDILCYLDHFPIVPNYLIKEARQVLIDNKNIFHQPDYKNYKIFEAPINLKNFVNEFLPNHYVFVHSINEHLLIHRDYKRKTAYNYIIDSGGLDVETCFYDNNCNLISKFKIDKCRWHRLDVSILHNVVNLTNNRIAITANLPL